MAFTVGWPDGLSIVSVAYADEYFADRANAAWAAADDGAKQGALVRATDYINTMFAARFDPLLFTDVDGNPVLPEELERACCEYALVELKTPGGLAPAPEVQASGYAVVTTKSKVGPLERNFSVVGGASGPLTRRPFPVPDALIASLLTTVTVALNRVTR